jgi:hypothetical protein
LSDGDVIEIGFEGFGRSLINKIVIDKPITSPVGAKAMV